MDFRKKHGWDREELYDEYGDLRERTDGGKPGRRQAMELPTQQARCVLCSLTGLLALWLAFALAFASMWLRARG